MNNKSLELVKPKFLIGIEFEGMIRKEIYDQFADSLRELGYDKQGESLVQFGTDLSIKNIPQGYEGIEIRTKIMTYYAGLRFFENMLSFLYDASITEDFLTNDSCGLHINISEKLIFSENKQKLFYAHVLQTFEDERILELFLRLNNKYCRPAKMFGKDLKFITENINNQFGYNPETQDKFKGPKYMAASLRNSPEHSSYNGPKAKANRIEFRCMGGEDYHLEFDKLTEAMLHIHKILKESFRKVVPNAS